MAFIDGNHSFASVQYDVIAASGLSVKVAPGDRVVAGETILIA